VGTAIAVLFSGTAAGQPLAPSPEEMWRIIQEQARQLDAQRQEIEALKSSLGMVEVTQERTETAVAEAQEAAKQAQAAAVEAQLAVVDSAPGPVDVSMQPHGGDGWWNRTSLGGYGELHYNGGSTDRIDFHRFVLFLGHEFTNDIRFFSELEVEHSLAGDGAPGAVELEQAYIQLDLNDRHHINAGLQLVPVGIINPTHEPPTFFGVERNPIESNIIPTTWWEAGVGFDGNFGASGISYDVMASSGLNVPVTGGNAFRIRSGRQKVSNATAKAPAVTGRLRYTGIPGLELAASGRYEFDVTQETGDPVTGEDVSGFLFSTHADARFGGFGLRALYASWWLNGSGARAIGRDRQTGFYLEPSYRFPFEVLSFGGQPGELGAFYRYSWWDNTAGKGAPNTAINQHTLGLNYWPHPNVVFKFDYSMDKPDSGPDSDGINLGVGFQF